MLEIRRPLGSILNRLNKKNEKNLFVKSGIGIFFVVIIMFLVQHIQASDIRADVDGQNGIDSTDAILTLRNSLGLDMSSTN